MGPPVRDAAGEGARWARVLRLLPAIERLEQAAARPPDPIAPTGAADGPAGPSRSSGTSGRTGGPPDAIRFPPMSGGASSLSWVVQSALLPPGFDWVEFVDSARGRAVAAALEAGDVGTITLEDCRAVLITLARQAHFVEGALDAAIRAGTVGLVLRRARELLGSDADAG